MQIIFSLFSLILVLIPCHLAAATWNQTDRLCADINCLEPISFARSLVVFTTDRDDGISFRKGEILTIFSKCLPEDKNGRWEAQRENDLKRGYVFPNLVQEFKILHKGLVKVSSRKGESNSPEDHESEETPQGEVESIPMGGVAAELGDGSTPTTPYEVIDGTTLPIGTDGGVIKPSATEEPAMQTKATFDKPTHQTDGKETVDNDVIEDEEDEGEDEDDDEEEGDSEDEEGEEEDSANVEENLPKIMKPDDIMNSLFASIDEAMGSEPGKSPEIDAKILAMSKETFSAQEPSDQAPAVLASSLDTTTGNNLPPYSIAATVPLSAESKSLNSVAESPSSTVVVSPPANSKNLLRELAKETAWLPSATIQENVKPSSNILDKNPQGVSTGEQMENGNSPPNLQYAPSEENSMDAPIGEPIQHSHVSSPVLNSYATDLPLPPYADPSPSPPYPASEPSSVYPIPESKPPSIETNEHILEDQNSKIQANPTDTLSPPMHVDPHGDFQPAHAPLNADQAHGNLAGQASEDVPADTNYKVDSNSLPNESAVDSVTPSPQTELPIQPYLQSESKASNPEMIPVPNDGVAVLSDGKMNTGPYEKITSNYEAQENGNSYNQPMPTMQENATDTVQTVDNQQQVDYSHSSYEENNTQLSDDMKMPSNHAEMNDPAINSISTQTLNDEGSQQIEPPIHDVKKTLDESSVATGDQEQPEQPGFFAGLFSSMFGSEAPADPEQAVPEEVPTTSMPDYDHTVKSEIDGSTQVPDTAETVIVPEGECKSISGLESDCADAPSPAHLWEFLDYKPSGSSNTILYLIITSVTVLLFTLGHYFIERSRQDQPLVAKINRLTHDLQVATSQLDSKSYQDSQALSEVSNEVLAALQCELDELRRVKGDLDQQLESQQQELEAATEAGLELNRMLSDLLTQKKGSDHLLQSVEQLQGQLDSQQRVIDEMNRNLQEKSAENQALQAESLIAQERIDSLEEELNDMRQNLNLLLKEKEEVISEFEVRNKKIEAELATLTKVKSAEIAALEKTLQELSERSSQKDAEFKALTETIEELQRKDGVDSSALLNVGHTKAELSRMLAERDSLQERLNEEEGARKLLEDHVKSVDNEVESLRKSCEVAEKEKIEAETRLTVLSNYFKDKETQLQKELGLQEAMWAQKQGDDSTIFAKIKSMQEEVENYSFPPIQKDVAAIDLSTVQASSLPTLLHEAESEPRKTDTIRSLPSLPSDGARPRRKSSAAFEARLERAEIMTERLKTRNPSLKACSDELLQLNEMKTVWASPFRDTSDSRCSLYDKSIENDISSSCSEMINKFEGMNRKPRFFSEIDLRNSPPRLEPTGNEGGNEIILADNANDNCFKSVSIDDASGLYGPAQSIYPVAAPKENHSSLSLSSLSESEYSTIQASSATVKLDIQLVANKSSKKKMRNSSRRRDGAQNELLKKEILDQERGLKGQIATLEKKAHENWVAARQAERRLEESKQESGQLRNMLTLIEKSTLETDAKSAGRSPGEINGDSALGPLLNDIPSPLPFPAMPLDPLAPPMLPPGFIPPFMPIPPPPFLPGDRRPAPLGRMSSPPINSRYSPSPGDSEYDRMSPPPMPPPNRNYRSPMVDGDRFRHRTPPSPSFSGRPWEDAPPRGFRPVNSQRDSRRDYQGSNLSSGHSSNDSLDKSNSRHGGKV